jgi:hypothetical protein
MPKLNPGLMPQVVAHPIRKLTKRALDRAIRKFAKFLNVDPSLEDVVAAGQWWGYSIGNSHRYVFMVDDHSDYAKMALDSSEMWDLAISAETDKTAVLIIK